MHRLAFLILLVLAASARPAAAQQSGEGSVYSRYGLGELSSFYSSKSQAMGGGALAFSSTTLINLANPASLSDQVLTRLSGGFRFVGIETTDALDVQSTLSSSSFDGLSVGFPILTSRLGVGIGFTEVSKVGYLIDVSKPLDLGEVDSGGTFSTRFQGSGGLNRISLGTGYRVSSNLSVGLRGDVIFGLIENVQKTLFQDARFEDTQVTQSTRLRGYTAGLGARFSFRSVLREGDFFNMGAAVDLPTTLSGTRVTAEGEGLQADTLGIPVDGDASIPVSFAVGLLYQPSPVLSFVLDARAEPWSDFQSDFSFPGFVPGGASSFSDRTRVSGGIEYFPAGRDLFASYLQRTAYRLGVFHESGYVTPDAAEEISTFGISSGLSLPTLSVGTRIDINLDVGTRGNATGRLVRDRFFRIGLHFNFAERWFARRQLG